VAMEQVGEHEGEGGEQRHESEDGHEGERRGTAEDAVLVRLDEDQPREGERALEAASPAWRVGVGARADEAAPVAAARRMQHAGGRGGAHGPRIVTRVRLAVRAARASVRVRHSGAIVDIRSEHMAEKKAGAAASEAIGEARERLTEAARDAGERYQKVAEEMRREAERAAKTAREKVDTAMTGLRQGYSKVQKNMSGWGEDLSDFVRDNPGRSLLIAAGVGFVVGLLFRRGDD